MTKTVVIMMLAITASSSSLAAPSINADTLKRPSPINPAIPMDPKPAETITVITDPKELAKVKREIGIENSEYSITAPTTVRPTEENQQNNEHEITLSTSTAVNQFKHRQKRAENDEVHTQPLIYRDEHKQPAGVSVAPQILPAPIPPPEHQTRHEAQNLPKYYDAGKHSEMKRDIPVPLVPKYHHLEETPQEEDKHENNLKNASLKNDPISTTSTATIKASTTNTPTHH